MRRDSSIGIATRYGLDDPVAEFRWGRDFLPSSRPALGPTQPPIQCAPGQCRGYSGRGMELTTLHHISPRLKKKVPLHLYCLHCTLQGELYLYLGWYLGKGGLNHQRHENWHYVYIVRVITLQLWMEVSGFSEHQHISYRLHDVTSVLITFTTPLHYPYRI